MNNIIYIPELGQEWGGVRQYAVALIRILANDVSNKYFIYHNSADPEVMDFINTHSHLVLVKDSDVSLNSFQRIAVRAKEISNFFSKRIISKVIFEIKPVIDRLIRKYSIEVVHCPYQFIPNTKSAKLIVTLHDVQEIHFPDFFTAEERAYRAVNFLDYLRRADKVVVSYNHVKNDIIKYFSVPSEAINVILLDMGKLWFENFSDKDIISLSQQELPTPFLLYPANTWKHKNHSRLLHAIALLRDEYNCVVNIVCSGYQNKYFDEILSNELIELNLQNQVKFVGVVDESLLYNLYKQCLGVVVPTIYEAGSFPLMESILLKIPVICSNVTSLPETVGNEKFTFDPLDIREMAIKIMHFWNSKDFRDESIINSSIVGTKLTNSGSLEKFIDLYKSI